MNGALSDMRHVHRGICEFGLFPGSYVDRKSYVIVHNTTIFSKKSKHDEWWLFLIWSDLFLKLEI